MPHLEEPGRVPHHCEISVPVLDLLESAHTDSRYRRRKELTERPNSIERRRSG